MRIVELDERTVRFRHPLMRSAVRQSASVERRRRVHEALAETLEADPDRRVWHRAALITGEHEDVALELEEAGRRARRRGAIGVAATALRRAAELSDPAQRAGRLIAAAEVAFELGQPHIVAPLLREAEQLEPGPLDRARATWIDEMINLRAPSPTRTTASRPQRRPGPWRSSSASRSGRREQRPSSPRSQACAVTRTPPSGRQQRPSGLHCQLVPT